MSKFTDFIDNLIDGQDPTSPRPSNEPRDLTDEDHDSWQAALSERASAPPRPRTIEDVRRLIRHRNPVKWWQVQSDFRWVQKQMKQMGLNPEDARYIL